jgi:ATP-dependent Clp protease, protease subunit
MNMSKSWYGMRAGVRAATANISIYSDIGNGGLTVADFSDALKALGNTTKLHVDITSNGGDVSQGFAIYNLLKRHQAHKVVTINGLAASMASVIAMAGDVVVMPSNSMLMIHNPWGGVTGDADQILSFGEALVEMRDNIADAYVQRSGQKKSEVLAMMDRETWLTADESVSLGFADRVIDPLQMAAAVDTRRFKNTPVAYRQIAADWKPRTLDEIRVLAFQKWNAAGRTHHD